MVWRSQSGVFINFYGPLESLREFWYFVSREGYTEVDLSRTSGLEDKLRFSLFLGSELIRQFTPAGFVLVMAGFVAQWRRWPRAACWMLTLLFLGHTLPFLFLLHFDYDIVTRAVFAVYPHLAYGSMAIWLGLGIQVAAAAIARLAAAGPRDSALSWILGVAVAALILVQNFGTHDRRAFAAAEDYARSVLLNLPADADLFVSGDIQTHTLGYLRYVEGVRPDVTVYSLAGLVFANRLFEPLKTPAPDELRLIEQYVERSSHPICTTSTLAAQVAQVDYWLFQCKARETSAPLYRVELNDDLRAYFARVRAAEDHPDDWTAYHHRQLARRAGALLGRMESMAGVTGELGSLADRSDTFYGVLGYADGATFFPSGTPPLRNVVEALNHISHLPADAPKPDRARLLYLRGSAQERMGDLEQAVTEYQASLEVWPDAGNESLSSLLGIYRRTGADEAIERLRGRFPDAR
jgi:tetratricopeptide (TPR) repeat protein